MVVVLAMAVMFTGCDKTTGGGWFYNYGNEYQKVSFGFNAQPVGEPYLVSGDGTPLYLQDAKGQFQLLDYANKIKIHGTFTITLAYDPTLYEDYQVFGGTASVDGEEGFDVNGTFYDANHDNYLGPDDRFQIQAWKGSVSYDYFGVLMGGNLTTHK